MTEKEIRSKLSELITKLDEIQKILDVLQDASSDLIASIDEDADPVAKDTAEDIYDAIYDTYTDVSCAIDDISAYADAE